MYSSSNRENLAYSSMTFFSGMKIYADQIIDEIPIYIGKDYLQSLSYSPYIYFAIFSTLMWLISLLVCLIRFFTSHQQSSSCIGMGIPGLNQC